MKKLPQQIYVHLNEPETDDEYLNAEATVEEIAEKGVVKHVGLYVLKETFHVGLKVDVRGAKPVR